MFESIRKEEVALTLHRVKPDTLIFNLGDVVEGTLHITPGGGCQVELQGGYKFPEQHCPLCAARTIISLYFESMVADEEAGLSYQTYKDVFSSGVNSILQR